MDRTVQFQPAVPQEVESAPRGCPVHHAAHAPRKSTRDPGRAPTDAVVQDAAGTWHVRGYNAARTVLRSAETQQAGFAAELLQEARMRMTNTPILYLEGAAHREQRKNSARFFTPMAVSSNYRQLMEEATERLAAQVATQRGADLSQISMDLAVTVAAQVVGLTNSVVAGMDRRLDAFFTGVGTISLSWDPRTWLPVLASQWTVLRFYLFDVLPAIRARRTRPQEDVISYLLDQGYNGREILTECVTYAAAGMVTTREFISVAAWHLLDQPTLRAEYVAGDEETRYKILHETLRLEPVVSHLLRRAVEPITLESGGQTVTIPEGALIDLHIHEINADPAVAGAEGATLCPARRLQSSKTHDAVMSFGDGHHRCPGAYIAIQESDIFLRRLLALDGLHIVRPPTVTWNDLTQGYELRNFQIAL